MIAEWAFLFLSVIILFMMTVVMLPSVGRTPLGQKIQARTAFALVGVVALVLIAAGIGWLVERWARIGPRVDTSLRWFFGGIFLFGILHFLMRLSRRQERDRLRVNIFEGARRIALLLAVIAIALTVIGVVMHKPYLSASYIIARPDAPFLRTDQPCPTNAARHYFSAVTRGGREVPVSLCLTTMLFENGEQLVPYKIDAEGMIWGASPYSSEVLSYERDLERRFRFSLEDETEYDRQVSKARWANARPAAKYLVVGLAIWAGLVSVVGWIVRGFLGIPNGMDSRPEAPAA